KKNMVVAIDNFFGCYLLYSLNPRYKGRTYIGFTVNPERRILQHNAGKNKGGALRTSGKGPWDMTMIVHGFPSDIAALRFEWAWQNPKKSRRLKHVSLKLKKESMFHYQLRILSSILCQTPWKKLPLTVQWLMQKYVTDMSPLPPDHMPIAYGPITAKIKQHATKENGNYCLSLANRISLKSSKPSRNNPLFQQKCCEICNVHTNIETSVIKDCFVVCIHNTCNASYHILCLAKNLLSSSPEQLLPLEGLCPICKQPLLWGEIIRKSQGF
uniref:Structure-specific endonuclease subunit SLX1 homolog n=1 Tax=Ciona savignyi TaxID=51511 RepID=H2YCB7_CIOSA